jgi:3-oxoacyl-[acyl-carrier-protein] synthase-1
MAIYLGPTGMVCAVGLNAESAGAAMRAAIANFNELRYLDNEGEPIVAAMVPGLDSWLSARERLVEMLVMALRDCLGEKPTFPLLKVPLLVGLAEPKRPGSELDLAESVISEVQEKLDLSFHPKFSSTIPTGHTSGFEGLRVARELLRDGELPACMVCGVDSYVTARTLRWLDQHSRLKTSYNEHGLIPGEAAAAVLVQQVIATEPRAEVTGLGFGKEKSTIFSEEPLLGLGLSDAARMALEDAGFGFHEMDWRISDVTGEEYGFKELALAEARLARVIRKQGQPVWHCADSIGDCGAAAGIIQLVIAERALRKAYAPGDSVICLTSSVTGDRAAAIVRRGKHQTNR